MKRNTLILIVLSFLTLAGLIVKARPGDLREEMTQADLWFVALAILVYFLTTFMKMLRWHLLLRSTGYRSGFRATGLFFLMGLSVNSVTPGGVSGEPIRLYFLRRSADVQVGHGMATIFAERFMDITVLVSFALFSVVFILPLLEEGEVIQLMIPMGIVCSLLLFVGYTVTHPELFDRITGVGFRLLHRFGRFHNLEARLRDWTDKFKSGILSLSRSRRGGVFYFLLSYLIWGLSTLRIYLLLHAMDVEVSLFAVFLTSSVTYLFGVILPGGTGNIAAIAAVFTAVGVDPTLAVAVGVLEVGRLCLVGRPLVCPYRLELHPSRLHLRLLLLRRLPLLLMLWLGGCCCRGVVWRGGCRLAVPLFRLCQLVGGRRLLEA